MSTINTSSSLYSFYIFNPTLGDESTEGRKILYYYPSSCPSSILEGTSDLPSSSSSSSSSSVSFGHDLNTQKDMVGIVEGLINFTRDFQHFAEAVHTKENRYAFFQPEKDFWIVMVIKNPTIVIKEKTNTNTEYLEEELDDSVLQAIIHKCYNMFKLFNGSFSSIVSTSSFDTLRHRLGLFFSYYIPTIRFSQLPCFTDIQGFQFLPVDKATFLTVQYLLNLLQTNVTVTSAAASSLSPTANSSPNTGLASTLPITTYSVVNTAIMYSGKLIYSGLKNQDDMFLLYSLEQLTNQLGGSSQESNGNNTNISNSGNAVSGSGASGSNASGNNGANNGSGGLNVSSAALFYAYLAQLEQIQWNKLPETIYNRSGEKKKKRLVKRTIQRLKEGSDDEMETVEIEEEEEIEPELPDPSLFDSVPEPIRFNATSSSTTSSSTNTTASAANDASNNTSTWFVGPLRKPLDNSTDKAARSAPKIYPNVAQHEMNHNAEFPFMETNTPFPKQSLDVTESKNIEQTSAVTHRLVVLQRFKITLFLVVAEEVEKDKKIGKANLPEASSQSAPSAAVATTPVQTSCPPTAFYEALDAFCDANLKKLAEMLQEQSARIVNQDDHYRFLYFNHMNLALKTSLNAKNTALSIDTIKLIREIHEDFNTPDFRTKFVSGTSASSESRPPHTSHHADYEGSVEVCVRTKTGWVVGRRATQSHREFFLLLEDKAGNLADIQEEVEQLAGTYFYNIFIH